MTYKAFTFEELEPKIPTLSDFDGFRVDNTLQLEKFLNVIETWAEENELQFVQFTPSAYQTIIVFKGEISS